VLLFYLFADDIKIYIDIEQLMFVFRPVGKSDIALVGPLWLYNLTSRFHVLLPLFNCVDAKSNKNKTTE